MSNLSASAFWASLLVAGFWLHWRHGGPLQPRDLLIIGTVSASFLVLVTWFSFQTGLAAHELPVSLSGFLFDEP